MELLKRAKRFLKGLKKNAGFTLPEVTAVVAITGTLAAIVVPVAIDQVEKGRLAGATGDIFQIQGALTAFAKDTGEGPDRKGTSPDFYYILRSGNKTATFDLFDTPTTGNVEDPNNGNTNWTSFASGSGKADSLVNHLTLDNPGNLGPSYRAAGIDVNWNGPYMPQVFNDPWGRNYLVYIRAFYATNVSNIGTSGETGFVQGGDIYGWVISGGPNKTLETNVTSPILNDDQATGLTDFPDDIGRMVFKAREAVPGVSGG